LRAEFLGAAVCGEAGELAAQGFHFRRPVKAEESAEVRRVTLFELFGSLDA
jgi:hypothetical protein